MPEIYDVLIIGAGASGMMAATAAGKEGAKTAVLEKKSRPGIKLSITGKGRCNITNNAEISEFVSCFRNGNFLHGSFRAFSNNDAIDFFENLGVACKLERGGRYFPASDKALDVVNAMVKSLKKHSEIITSFEVKSVIRGSDGNFSVYDAHNSVLTAKKIIIACGGLSYPSTGSTGDGYKIAHAFGHKVITPAPALVPVILESAYLKELKGLKLKNVKASVISDGKNAASEFGEMEFTVFGADGPVILTLSGLINEKITSSEVFLSLNLKPALTKEQISARLQREMDNYGQYQIKEMLKEMLPKQMIKAFIDYCGLNMTQKCAHTSRYDREKMTSAFADFRFKAKGVKNIKEAIITRGGVSTDEINQKTMESKIIKGLFFCGEVIDIDAPTGGFNLQAAFSTGYLAGKSAGLKS